MFRKDSVSAEVYRQGYTDSDGYSKSSYTTTGNIYKGHHTYLSITDNIELSDFGKVSEFTTNADVDIRESDRLKIDGEMFEVQGIIKSEGITFSRISVSLKNVKY